MKIKIAHIHSDFKFILETSHSYNCKDFENTVIILDKKNHLNEKYHNSASFIEPKNRNLSLILKICKGADLVVLYDLTTFKCKIALALPKDIKIAWRFFGYELYSRNIQSVTSKKTQLLLETLQTKENKKILKVKLMIKKIFFKKNIFLLSMNRINYFFGLYEQEYNHLKMAWPKLPQFVSILVLKGEINDTFLEKEPYFIVGNNRSFYNNHFDIINIIKSRKNPNSYTAKFFFNYGNINNYSNFIKDTIQNHTSLELIENFLTFEDFETVYCKASAFIMNGYRQMALGNIFTALKHGVKIYLNTKNDTLQWLRSKGFFVFTIEDFEKDYEEGNLKLSKNEAMQNIYSLKRLYDQSSPSIFQERLKMLVKINRFSKVMGKCNDLIFPINPTGFK